MFFLHCSRGRSVMFIAGESRVDVTESKMYNDIESLAAKRVQKAPGK